MPELGNEMTSAMDSGCFTLLGEDSRAAISCCIAPTPKPTLPQSTCSVYCTTPWIFPATTRRNGMNGRDDRHGEAMSTIKNSGSRARSAQGGQPIRRPRRQEPERPQRASSGCGRAPRACRNGTREPRNPRAGSSRRRRRRPERDRARPGASQEGPHLVSREMNDHTSMIAAPPT